MSAGPEAPPRDDQRNLLDSIQDGVIKELIRSINTRGTPATPQMKREPVTPATPGISKIPTAKKPSESSKRFTRLKRLKFEKLLVTPITSIKRQLPKATLVVPTPKRKVLRLLQRDDLLRNQDKRK